MFLLIDKPKGITSHDVVDAVRKITGERRVGHAGTLDPNATGLLIVGVGRESTKKLGKSARNTTKVYVADIVLGEERDTDDVEGRSVKRVNRVNQVNQEVISEALESFVGSQKQVPPKYSAVKIKGKPAYKRVRRGEKIELKPRKITIYSIKLLDYSYPLLRIKTQVSSGTYIRALARDIGRKLGSGAHLKNLRRTKIGRFSLKDAVKLNKLNEKNWKKFSISIN